jgi:thiol-disulfide isomerase/thioredoxin
MPSNNWLRLSCRLPFLLVTAVVASAAIAIFEKSPPAPVVAVQQVVQPPGESFFKEPVAVPDFPQGLDWINTNSKLQMSDLRGKLVLLDFWTYCCINCMHVLPVLDEVEKKYDKQMVVVGVHTAKFETEKDTENIRDAIMRYEIRHPVINDSDHVLWNQLKIDSWPTLVLIDPQGRAIWANAGEVNFTDLDRVLQRAVAYYQRRGEIDTRSVHFKLEMNAAKDTPLRYPGKVLADGVNQRLFIADSNHNRIVVSDLNGKLLMMIGQGKVGAKDGDFATAEFNHPQGLALSGDTLFVADTENHLIRAVDLKAEKVRTVAGTGRQTHNAWFGADANAAIGRRPTRSPLATDLASPWGLMVNEEALYIAMAGTHQIWALDLAGKAIGPFAGNGREDIVDGPLLPKIPYALGASSFAQPSGLATDGKQLFVADSEGSSIRKVPLSGAGKASTIVGTAALAENRLFVFGDTDGPTAKARLQHPLDVAYGAGRIYVADTYNSKIREIDLAADSVSTLEGGETDGEQLELDEPSGLSLLGDQLFIADTNHHRICVLDVKSKRMRTLEIEGLQPLVVAKPPKAIKLPSGAVEHTVGQATVGNEQTEIKIPIKYELADGWKLNLDAPQGYVAIWKDSAGKMLEADSVSGKFAEPGKEVALDLRVPGGTDLKLQIGLTYYFCKSDGTGLCLADSSIYSLQVTRGAVSNLPPIAVRIVPVP